METKLPELTRAINKPLNMPLAAKRARLESFCENCKQKSIKWGFCFICGFEGR